MKYLLLGLLLLAPSAKAAPSISGKELQPNLALAGPSFSVGASTFVISGGSAVFGGSSVNPLYLLDVMGAMEVDSNLAIDNFGQFNVTSGSSTFGADVLVGNNAMITVSSITMLQNGVTFAQAPVLPNVFLNMVGNVANYDQMNITNLNAGVAGQSAIVMTQNNGNDTIYYSNIFQNSSGYNQAAYVVMPSSAGGWYSSEGRGVFWSDTNGAANAGSDPHIIIGAGPAVATNTAIDASTSSVIILPAFYVGLTTGAALNTATMSVVGATVTIGGFVGISKFGIGIGDPTGWQGQFEIQSNQGPNGYVLNISSQTDADGGIMSITGNGSTVFYGSVTFQGANVSVGEETISSSTYYSVSGSSIVGNNLSISTAGASLPAINIGATSVMIGGGHPAAFTGGGLFVIPQWTAAQLAAYTPLSGEIGSLLACSNCTGGTYLICKTTGATRGGFALSTQTVAGASPCK